MYAGTAGHPPHSILQGVGRVQADAEQRSAKRVGWLTVRNVIITPKRT